MIEVRLILLLIADKLTSCESWKFWLLFVHFWFCHCVLDDLINHVLFLIFFSVFLFFVMSIQLLLALAGHIQ